MCVYQKNNEHDQEGPRQWKTHVSLIDRNASNFDVLFFQRGVRHIVDRFRNRPDAHSASDDRMLVDDHFLFEYGNYASGLFYLLWTIHGTCNAMNSYSGRLQIPVWKPFRSLRVYLRQQRRSIMHKAIIGLTALAAIAIATPASAQRDEDGWRDGRHDNGRHLGWRDRRHDPEFSIRLRTGRDAYGSGRDCSMRVTRYERPNGTTVTRRERRCD